MKDQEFIELLNLYLDHEISAADAARLEAEVQGNARRRAIYKQYCRMQKACTVIGADFRSENEVAFDPAVAAVERARRSRRMAYYGLGSLVAAAACVAFIFSGRVQPTAQGTVAVAPVSAVSTTDVGVPARTGGIVQRPMLVTDSLLLTGLNRSEAGLTPAAKQAAEQLEWLHAVTLTPLQVGIQAEDLRFDLVPAALRLDARALGTSAAKPETTAEMIGFQFKKD